MGSLGRTVPLVQPGSGLGEKLARRGGGGGADVFRGGGEGTGGKQSSPSRTAAGTASCPGMPRDTF